MTVGVRDRSSRRSEQAFSALFPGTTVEMHLASMSSVGSPFVLDVHEELRDAERLGRLATYERIAFDVARGRRNLWLVASVAGRERAALRLGHGGDELGPAVTRSDSPGGTVFEFTSALGALRAKIAFPSEGQATVRCTTSLLPARDVAVPYWPRDLYALDASEGTVHTAQRGLRSGIVFASTDDPAPCTLFYFQDFSSSTRYFEATKRSPSGTVGGRWPELGYAPPSGEDCVLPGSRELVVSDAYLTVTDAAPASDGAVAATYLDLLAQTYLCLPRPPVAYHDWPGRAARALRDLSLSPACTYVRGGTRYVMPYVRDETKPPESMVQFTLAANAGEYGRWRGEQDVLADALRATARSFFDGDVGSVVRWLPGAEFGESQAEDNMNHEAMDSWYLHHALFNLLRFAADGDGAATDLVRRSLPFVVRAARRFDYIWPVFFNLRTLDVVRAEAEPGKGGEHDVGGLYALVMLHAHEMFGEQEYLDEAHRALRRLSGLGFTLGYQMNTTGFAAEAAMRLWKKTGDRLYLELSEICMANLFDNMWLWRCEYGRARHYRTFFGLFPLRDAPYLAAYEELEAQAKFHDYLALGGDDVRPSLRLLIAEYQRYSLDRGWFYYPASLPQDVLAEKSRNGRIERALAVPVEDLQDGWEASGQVGQELYGAGLPFVYTSRHYMRIAAAGCLAFCDYPMYDFELDAHEQRATWRAGGDPRCSCELRLIPLDPAMEPIVVDVTTRAGDVVVPLHGTHSVEGHAAFAMRGGQTVAIRWRAGTGAQGHGVAVGGLGRAASARA
jgi:hypothetical protein